MDYDLLTKKLDVIRKLLTDKDLYYYKHVNELNIQMAYHSNALEGNTLSLYETKLIFEGSSVGDKTLREVYEAKNHIEAFRHIWELCHKPHEIINESDILSLNSIILEGITDKRGQYRKNEVAILGSDVQLARAEEIKSLMAEFSQDLIKQQKDNIKHPVELASEAHYKLVKIHPFEDGNGRTSRLLMNAILIKNSYPVIIIELAERNKYLTALNKTDKTQDLNYFNEFVYNKVLETLNNYIEKVNKVMDNKAIQKSLQDR
jgi:Fic family protein